MIFLEVKEFMDKNKMGLKGSIEMDMMVIIDFCYRCYIFKVYVFKLIKV